LFASTTVFAGMAVILGQVLCDKGRSRKIRILTSEGALAYLIVVLLMTPYLYFVFAYGVPAPINPSSLYSNDLLSFFIPTFVLCFGPLFDPIVDHFKWHRGEVAAFLGPGSWIILVLYARAFWSSSRGKFLILGLLITGMMSLGPVLHIGGISICLAPWWPFSKLPLIDQALPARFGVYFFLTAAVLISSYLSDSASSTWCRTILAALCLLFLTPNLLLFRSIALTHFTMPPMFLSEEYKHYLAKDDNILVLPFVETENGMLWQAQTDFYFRLAAARLTLPPSDFSGWPVLSTLYSGLEIKDFAEQFRAFLGANQVKAVIVDPYAPQPWMRLLLAAGMRPLAIGGVWFYKVPSSVLVAFRSTTAHEMAEREAAISLQR
jgi:hypothetical protein